MKKISVLSIILLLILSYFFNIYSANYPLELRINNISFNSNMKIFIYTFFIILLLSTLLAFIPFKNKKYNYKFFLFFSIFNLVFIFINLIGSSHQYFGKKDEFENLLIKTKRQAEFDIKKDFIKYHYFGGDTFPNSLYSNHQKLNNEIDSLTKTYGIIYIDEGGAIDEVSIELNKKYDEYTESYLEKRNGKNWKDEMKNEIELIKNKYKR